MNDGGGRAHAVLLQALASVDAATASASAGNIDAALDDLLAARLLLTSLIETFRGAPLRGPIVG